MQLAPVTVRRSPRVHLSRVAHCGARCDGELVGTVAFVGNGGEVPEELRSTSLRMSSRLTMLACDFFRVDCAVLKRIYILRMRQMTVVWGVALLGEISLRVYWRF